MKNLEKTSLDNLYPYNPPSQEEIESRKDSKKVYVGIPSGSLQSQTIRLLLKSGFIDKDPGRTYEIPSTEKQIIFRVQDRKEMAMDVRAGIVDAGITGKDYITETGQTEYTEPISNFTFSKTSDQPSRLVMVSNPETIQEINQCRGVRIATELPRLTRQRLRELFDFSDEDLSFILPSEGKTEQKLKTGWADAVSEITETGTTIQQNGLQILGKPLFYSTPQLIANQQKIRNIQIRSVLEDIAIAINAILKSEREPKYYVRMNVPKRRLDNILKLLPSNIAPTISEINKDGWVALGTVVPQKGFNQLALKLLNWEAEGIIPSNIDAIFTQSLRENLKA